MGGDVAGEANGTLAVCYEFCGGVEVSLDESGNLQSVSAILGVGYGFQITSDIISYQEWVFWQQLDGSNCSNLPGTDANSECPGE